MSVSISGSGRGQGLAVCPAGIRCKDSYGRKGSSVLMAESICANISLNDGK